MKISNLSLVLILFCMIGKYWCVAQEDNFEERLRELDSRRTMPLHYRNIYEISKDVYGWYPISFIQLENYSMFRDEDYHVFLLTDYDDAAKPNSKNIIDRKDVFLVGKNIDSTWEMQYMTFYEAYQFYKLIPDSYSSEPKGIQFKENNTVNNLTQVRYSPQPTEFLLILMTGEAYNHVTHGGGTPPLDFPDKNAYYRVLLPVWPNSNI